MYLSLRRLFLERTGATHDFNFYDYLRESMEEDMSSLIGMTVMMWSMATVFVTIPEALFLPAGLVCLGIMIFVGTMLESVALRLSQAAYERFADDIELEEEEERRHRHQKSPAGEDANCAKRLIHKTSSGSVARASCSRRTNSSYSRTPFHYPC